MYSNYSYRSCAAPARGFMASCAVLLAYGVLGAVATVLSTPAHAQSFSGLGFLPGGSFSRALGVNADGTVVVGDGNATGIAAEAFRWTQTGGMVALGFLTGGTSSHAQGVNADGTVVVGFGDAPGIASEAFRWTQAGGIVGLGLLRDHPGPVASFAFGVNADGMVVVGSSSSRGVFDPVAFRWTQAGGLVPLFGLPGGNFSGARGVNADGTVVVGASQTVGPSREEASRWIQAGGIAGLGFLPDGTDSEALGVNADGTVVVGSSESSATSGFREAFRWTQTGGMAGLGVLTGGTFSSALGVNADGTVVVGVGDATGVPQEAFRWTQAGGMQSVQALLAAKGISTTGWKLTSAQGVSADGQVIVGIGADPNGRQEGWIANLGPPRVSFLAFSARLEIDLERKPKKDRFELESSFTLSSTASKGINPLTEPVTLQIGTFTTTMPPGSFKRHKDGDGDEDEHEDGFFIFHRTIDGVRLKALIKQTGTLRFAFHARGKGANLTGTKNPVTVMLTIGDDSGTTSVAALIIH